MKRILAVASDGGHWEQLKTMSPAFEGYEVIFVCTNPDALEKQGNVGFVISDFDRTRPVRAVRCFFELVGIVRRTKPDLVFSTGAAPGLFACIVGRVIGAITVWVDSVANAERMSLSGRIALPIVHVHLTQWQHLAQQEPRTRYVGSVL